MCMARKKRELKQICGNITIEAYKMLEQLTNGGQYYMCQQLEECIRGKYYSIYKSNKFIDTSINTNIEVVKQLQEQSVNKNQITLDEVLNEQEELERLKAERRARKSGDFNA